MLQCVKEVVGIKITSLKKSSENAIIFHNWDIAYIVLSITLYIVSCIVFYHGSFVLSHTVNLFVLTVAGFLSVSYK